MMITSDIDDMLRITHCHFLTQSPYNSHPSAGLRPHQRSLLDLSEGLTTCNYGFLPVNRFGMIAGTVRQRQALDSSIVIRWTRSPARGQPVTPLYTYHARTATPCDKETDVSDPPIGMCRVHQSWSGVKSLAAFHSSGGSAISVDKTSHNRCLGVALQLPLLVKATAITGGRHFANVPASSNLSLDRMHFATVWSYSGCAKDGNSMSIRISGYP
jgi:hypothetical protein